MFLWIPQALIDSLISVSNILILLLVSHKIKHARDYRLMLVDDPSCSCL